MKATKCFLFLPLLLMFQASYAGRHYDSRVARWLIPDPALRDGSPQEQMKKYGTKLFSTSPYGYSFNNPVLFNDPNGNWPMWVHHSFIQQAFSNNAAYAGKIRTLQGWSDYADIPRFQSPEFSFMHAMGVQGETQEATIEKINNHLNFQFSTDPDADFGVKLHTIMDVTSPSHGGEQSWGEVSIRDVGGLPTKVYTSPNILSQIGHSALEVRASILEQRATVRLMKQFGADYGAHKKIDIRQYQQMYRKFLLQETVNAELERFDALR